MKPYKLANVMIIQDNKVLLVQQRKDVAYGLWGFPGGHVEDGETYAQAAAREVHEEVGLQVSELETYRTVDLQTKTGNATLTVFCASASGELKLKDDELLAYGWFSLESVRLMQPVFRAQEVYDIAIELLEKGQNRT